MTLRVPSAFAALTRASMPPRSSADLAVAASEPLPPLESPPPEPHAVRVSPAVTTATAVRGMLRRTCPPEVVPRPLTNPVDPRAGWLRDCGRPGHPTGGYGTRTCGEPMAQRPAKTALP